MTTILPSEFKRGTLLLLDGVLHRIGHDRASGQESAE
jgi:hypothetical protein